MSLERCKDNSGVLYRTVVHAHETPAPHQQHTHIILANSWMENFQKQYHKIHICPLWYTVVQLRVELVRQSIITFYFWRQKFACFLAAVSVGTPGKKTRQPCLPYIAPNPFTYWNCSRDDILYVHDSAVREALIISQPVHKWNIVFA